MVNWKQNIPVHQYQEDQSISCYGKKVTTEALYEQAYNYALTPQISTKYHKIPKISPSKYQPPALITQKTVC